MINSFVLIKKLLSFWREFIIVILAGVCYYYYSRPNPVPSPAVEYITKVQKEKEYIRVTEPTGRIVEKFIERDKVKTKIQVTPAPRPLPKYSVGSIYDFKEKSFQFEASYRVKDSPLSAVVGYNTKDRSILAGIRLDF